MGLVGARFEKSEFMEYALMAVTNEQNTEEHGYGAYTKEEKENDVNMDDVDALKRASKSKTKQIWRAFEKFYCRKYFPTYTEIKSKYMAHDKEAREKYYQKSSYYSQNSNFLDVDMFAQRIRISIELFLFDADRRAAEYKKEKKTKSGAFCHIVGLGTGVWSFVKAEQDRIIVKVTKDVVQKTHLPNIDKIYFAWMHGDAMNESEHVEESIFGKKDYVLDKSNEHKIYVESGKRSPAEEYEDDRFKDCLNVSMYAWDSNSFPGNEYYLGMLSASGDPAAASCSTISYVQNSEINKENINGANSGIYFYNPQAQKYEFYKMKDIDFEQNKEKWLKMSRNSLPSKR